MFKLHPEFKAAWLAALRSGEYEQGRRALKAAGKFCCLGVACDVAINMGLVQEGWDNSDEYRTIYGYGSLPPVEVVNAVFNLNLASVEASRVGVWQVQYKDKPWTLFDLNDDEALSFTEIADIIEQQL